MVDKELILQKILELFESIPDQDEAPKPEANVEIAIEPKEKGIL